ncbi:MAG: hypothetical protein KBB01_05790 [Candidatus Omnitrophica bacterium]|jgi:adenine-specific DNA methylase|nr:hypothetical protein [Candidatus Omnitrophota bacterium]
MRKYSKEKTIAELHKSLQHLYQLYNAKCINWSGKVLGAKEEYSEVISAELLDLGIEKLMREEIKPIGRPNYHVDSHQKQVSRSKTNREEENFAKSLVWLKLERLGEILDFQIPLKNKKSDKAGKIDLVSYKHDNLPVSYIIELKYSNNKETLLRSVLEITTYYCQLNKDKFLKSFEKFRNLTKEDIKKAVLLMKGASAYYEAKEELTKKPKLTELIKKLGVEIFLLEYNVSSIKL